MVSALYAVLGALLLIKFSFDVVRTGAFLSCKAQSGSTATRSSTFPSR
ncbi:inner membrane protein [Enterobacter cloacae]|nr:inner membrane protein [Enterobacter cloacae]